GVPQELGLRVVRGVELGGQGDDGVAAEAGGAVRVHDGGAGPDAAVDGRVLGDGDAAVGEVDEVGAGDLPPTGVVRGRVIVVVQVVIVELPVEVDRALRVV